MPGVDVIVTAVVPTSAEHVNASVEASANVFSCAAVISIVDVTVCKLASCLDALMVYFAAVVETAVFPLFQVIAVVLKIFDNIHVRVAASDCENSKFEFDIFISVIKRKIKINKG